LTIQKNMAILKINVGNAVTVPKSGQ